MSEETTRPSDDRQQATFAIDYDGTWTTDPAVFKAFAKLLRYRGHRVIIVTARMSGRGEVEREAGPHVDRVLFSAAEFKRDYARAQSERVDVWVDDMPEMIGPPVEIIGGQP